MGLRAGLDWCGKSRPNGIRSPDRPAREQSLYRLRYPAHKRKNKFPKSAALNAVVTSSMNQSKHKMCSNKCNYEIVVKD